MLFRSVSQSRYPLLDISRGTGIARQTFKDLGISVIGSNGQLRDSVSVMMDVADAVSKLKNETLQSAYASQIFGRSGTQLLPILKLGSAGFKQLEAEAKRLGIVWSSQDAESANNLMDATEALTGSIQGLKKAVATSLFPVLTEWVKKGTELIVTNREIIKNELLSWINNLASGLKMLWNYRDTIKNVFAFGVIAIAVNSIAGLVNSVMTLISALNKLGATRAFQELIKFMGGGSVMAGSGITLLS